MSEKTKSNKIVKKVIKVKYAKNNSENIDTKLAVLVHSMNQLILNFKKLPAPTVLLPEDFKSYVKFSAAFHHIHLDSLPEKFKFKFYIPHVFNKLRIRFQMDENIFSESFSKEPTIVKWNQNHYKSANKSCFVKILETEDIYSLLNIMPDYHNYMVNHKGVSFLPLYLGICRIVVDAKISYYTIMKNTFYDPYHATSTLARQIFTYSDKEADKHEFMNQTCPLMFEASAETKKLFLDQLKSDIDFLGEWGVSRISLLIRKYKIKEGRLRTLSDTELSFPDGADRHHSNFSFISNSDSTNVCKYIESEDKRERLSVRILDISDSFSQSRKAVKKGLAKESQEENGTQKPVKSKISTEKLLNLLDQKVFANKSR